MPLSSTGDERLEVLRSTAARVLGSRARVDATALSIDSVAGGANNRVFRVGHAGERFLLKSYFWHAADPRDRLKAERAFYEYAWRIGARTIPEPLGWDAEERVGVFRFVEGRKLSPVDLRAEHVRQAVAFLALLNAPANRATADLPDASEACFSIVEHLTRIDFRVRRLFEIADVEEVDRSARAFVTEELAPAWERVRAAIEQGASASGIDAARPLAFDDRCVSPSDFGFHNALVAGDGTLRFFDFEYSGWDDPAKLVCDFFCQPQVPVSSQFWTDIAAGLVSRSDMPALVRRSRLLFPAYQVKWCCIRLNEFLRVDSGRRSFSTGRALTLTNKVLQLARARAALAECTAAAFSTLKPEVA